MMKVLENLGTHIEECSMIRHAQHAFNIIDDSSCPGQPSSNVMQFRDHNL
jgi:hypothetical protein